MAARSESPTVGYWCCGIDGARHYALRRGQELFFVWRSKDFVACGGRGLHSLDIALLRLHCICAFARTRPVQSQRAGENELRIRRRSFDGSDVVAHAFDAPMAF